ncbi:MAG: outer membrane lipid asymmetry maintenance protein MlaD [Gammaproteobacteria bacterium]|nr:outer membrane lipid asymmetry maintenance protein MlaD [Gammaproteobacteria bacterium]
MMNTRTVEIVVGLFIAAGLAALFMLAMKVSNLANVTDNSGYVVTARFNSIGGLKVRAPVSMAGVTIGRVTGIDLDNNTYQAEVKMFIYARYNHIPEDSSARIFTAGLLGEQYVSLQPGGSDTFLKNGGRIKLTQSAVSLEQLIGQMLFNKAAGGGAK